MQSKHNEKEEKYDEQQKSNQVDPPRQSAKRFETRTILIFVQTARLKTGAAHED